MFDPKHYGSDLSLGADGIWHSASTAALSYPVGGNDDCFGIEDRSFWFRHRNACIGAVVRQTMTQHAGPLFDVGGGNGFVAKGLVEQGIDTVLVEPGLAGARNARQRGVMQVVCATAANANFRAQSLPSVGLFDVIEHIEDEHRFLADIRALIRPGGHVFATVPAYQWLWSGEDEAAGHFRRYTPTQIGSVLERAGFKLVFCSGIFRPLVLPIALMRAVPHRLGFKQSANTPEQSAQEHGASGGLGARVMNRLLAPELVNLTAGRSMAIGASCLVVARAP